MDLVDQLRILSSRIPQLVTMTKTEEATKHALVMPFIRALGYDPFDPMEVVPEFIADVGIKKGEKIDYAIMRDGKPIMLFMLVIGRRLENHYVLAGERRERAHAKELETLRNDLQVLSHQKQIVFTKLHERRAEVMAEAFANLMEVHNRCQFALMPPEPFTPKDAQEQAAKYHDIFSKHFARHRIYFSPEVVKKVEKMEMELMVWIATLHTFRHVMDAAKATGEDTAAFVASREMMHMKKFNEVIRPLEEEIAVAFREILGA